MRTQASSKPRIKHDALGNNALTELYAHYAQDDLEEFKAYCAIQVGSGTGSSEKKNQLIRSIHSMEDKGQVLKKAQDFILAGMGLGV